MLTMFVLFAILFHSVSAHLEWALENGGYLHPALEYRDSGMYAKERIDQGEILAKIPLSLELNCQNCKVPEEMVDVLNKEKDGFWAPYIESLPTNCQNALCAEPDKNVLTTLGHKVIVERYAMQNNLTSAIESRWWRGNFNYSTNSWSSGMRPLIELFNHDDDASLPVHMTDVEEYVIVTNKPIVKGEQAYVNYVASMWQLYIAYGFVPSLQTPSCDDMRLLRGIGSDLRRVTCIAYSNSTLEEMVLEIKESSKRGDIAMIKGAAQWIDRNTDFVDF